MSCGVQAAEDLHERALAGAVVAHQPEHLAGLQREVDTTQHDQCAEPLATRRTSRTGVPLDGGRGDPSRDLSRCSFGPRSGDEAVELDVQRHRDDDHHADPDKELVGADPGQRQPVLEHADQDRADQARRSPSRARRSGLCRRSRRRRRRTGCSRRRSCPGRGVPYLTESTIPTRPATNEHSTKHHTLTRRMRHARLGRADEVAARGDDANAEAGAVEHDGEDDRDRDHPEDLGPPPRPHQLADEAGLSAQRDRRLLCASFESTSTIP